MTLSEMAAFVCGKVRARDTTATADAKKFLARRYQMLWEDQLWKDALRGYEFTLKPLTYTWAAMPFGNWVSAGAGIWHLPSGVDRMLALRKATGGVVVEDTFQFYRGGTDEFAETGEAVKFDVIGQAARDLTARRATVEALGVVISSSAAADNGQLLRVRYLDLDGEERTDSVALASGGAALTANPAGLLSVDKPVTTGTVDVLLDGKYVIRLTAAQTVAPQHLRIRLSPKPVVDTEFKALVKLKPQALTADADAPQLRGIENALLALVQGDMLERQRRYGQAQAKFAEGMALLDQLKRTEVMQEANLTRILPEVLEVSGSVGDGGFPSKGYF